MSNLEVISSLSIFITVWLGLWVLPHAIRCGVTGKFTSYYNKKVVIIFVSVFFLHSLTMFPEYGLNFSTFLRVLVIAVLPLISAYFMDKYYFSRIT